MGSDYQRHFTGPNEKRLMVGRWRGEYHVSVEHRGAFHSIGSFGKKSGIHAFQDGVSDGANHSTRLEQVKWASEQPAEDLPTEDIDSHWKG